MTKIGTHSGKFHADEALACAMLKSLPEFKDAEIVRSREDEVLKGCDIVVDVGAKYDHRERRYDHHQAEFNESLSTLVPGTPYVTKLSSAGLIYAHYGKDIIKNQLKESERSDRVIDILFEKVYRGFVEEIDATDNGIHTHDGLPRYKVTTTLSSRVANVNPKWTDKNPDPDAQFHKAMDLVASEFFDRVSYYAHVWLPARSVVEKALSRRFEVHESGRIVDFGDTPCPFTEHLYDLERELKIEGEILYAVSNEKDSVRVLALSVEGEKFNQRLKLKKEWRGLRNEELSRVSGISGGVFVHASGFIGGNKTREGALEMAVQSLKEMPIQ